MKALLGSINCNPPQAAGRCTKLAARLRASGFGFAVFGAEPFAISVPRHEWNSQRHDTPSFASIARRNPLSAVLQFARWPLQNTRNSAALNILVVDDEPRHSSHDENRARVDGPSRWPTPRTAPRPWSSLSHRPFEVALLDVRLGREQGVDLLPEMLRLAPDLQVIVFTAYATIENAVEAMRRGASDYILKPMTPDHLRVVIGKVARISPPARSRSTPWKNRCARSFPRPDLRTEDPAMRQELDVAFRAAASNATILILGESGTGKGVLARAIHAHSPQAHAPFVTIHCPSLSAELLESELFGHVRGAFTGAVADTLGKVHSASGGILFLDEIGDLPLALQPKLLRLLQEKRYERVGETRTRMANVRLLAATNHNLEADVAAGRFREDLFYRLNVISVTLPPLGSAERHPAAGPAFAGVLCPRSGKQIISFTPEAEAALLDCPWPDNIRELRNAIERAVSVATGPCHRTGRFAVPDREAIARSDRGRRSRNARTSSKPSIFARYSRQAQRWKTPPKSRASTPAPCSASANAACTDRGRRRKTMLGHNSVRAFCILNYTGVGS